MGEPNGLGPCAACGHDPACGFSSVTRGDGPTLWYCHDDDHSCFAYGTPSDLVLESLAPGSQGGEP